jgi:hypothetical protein
VISDEERQERERLQKEADQERKKIKLPKMMIGAVVFDTNDRETRLIGKTPSFLVAWNDPKYGQEEIYELYWRTKAGNYIVFFNGGSGGYSRRIDTKTAHDWLNIRTSDHKWFLT